MNVQLIEIIPNLSNDGYHARDEYSSSTIKTIVKTGSVSKALDGLNNTAPNKAMLLGSAWHSFLEGRDAFNQEVAVFDDREIMEELNKQYKNPRATTAYKDYKAEFEASAENRIVISLDDLVQFNEMYESMKANRWVAENVLNVPEDAVRDEWSYIWEYQDIRFRTRPDRQIDNFLGELEAIVDWKSCRDALSYDDDIRKWRHDISAIMYCAPLDIHPENFYFLASDKSKPYVTKEWGLSTKTIRKGWDDFHRAIKMIKHFEKTGKDLTFDKEVDRV